MHQLSRSPFLRSPCNLSVSWATGVTARAHLCCSSKADLARPCPSVLPFSVEDIQPICMAVSFKRTRTTRGSGRVRNTLICELMCQSDAICGLSKGLIAGEGARGCPGWKLCAWRCVGPSLRHLIASGAGSAALPASASRPGTSRTPPPPRLPMAGCRHSRKTQRPACRHTRHETIRTSRPSRANHVQMGQTGWNRTQETYQAAKELSHPSMPRHASMSSGTPPCRSASAPFIAMRPARALACGSMRWPPPVECPPPAAPLPARPHSRHHWGALAAARPQTPTSSPAAARCPPRPGDSLTRSPPPAAHPGPAAYAPAWPCAVGSRDRGGWCSVRAPRGVPAPA